MNMKHCLVIENLLEKSIFLVKKFYTSKYVLIMKRTSHSNFLLSLLRMEQSFIYQKCSQTCYDNFLDNNTIHIKH